MTKRNLFLVSVLLVLGLGIMVPTALAQVTQGNGTTFNVSPSLYTLRPNSIGDAAGPVYMTMASGLGTIAGGETFTVTYSKPIVGASGISSLSQATAAAEFCDDSGAGALATKFCSAMSYSAMGTVLTITNAGTPLVGLVAGNYIAFWGVRIDTVGLIPGSFITANVGAVLNQNYPISFSSPGVTLSNSVNVGQVASTAPGGTVLATLNYPADLLTCFYGTSETFSISVAEQWAGAWTSVTDELALAPYAPTATGLATNGSDISITFSGIPLGVTITPAAPANWEGTPLWGTFLPTTYTGAKANDTVTFDYPLATTVRDELEGANFVFTVSASSAISLQSPPMTASVTLNPMTPTSSVEYPAFTYPNGSLQEEPNYPLTVVDFIGCQTNLLFPYLTNYNGGTSAGALGNWDTAIVVSNTSSDPYGPGGPPNFLYNGAAPTAGSCTFYLYGATSGSLIPSGDANPVATFTTNVVYTGGIGAFLLSQTKAAGMTGYAIAICNFLNGTGYAEVVDNANGLGNWGIMGSYLAYVIPQPAYEPRWEDSIIGEFAITPWSYFDVPDSAASSKHGKTGAILRRGPAVPR